MCERNAQRARAACSSSSSSSCSLLRAERTSVREQGLSLALVVIHLTPFRLSAAATEQETIFLAVPELSIPGGFQSTPQSEEPRTGRRFVRTRRISIHSFPPLALPFSSVPLLPVPSAPFGRSPQRRFDGRSAGRERKWQQRHGEGAEDGEGREFTSNAASTSPPAHRSELHKSSAVGRKGQ